MGCPDVHHDVKGGMKRSAPEDASLPLLVACLDKSPKD